MTLVNLQGTVRNVPLELEDEEYFVGVSEGKSPSKPDVLKSGSRTRVYSETSVFNVPLRMNSSFFYCNPVGFLNRKPFLFYL